MLQYAYKQVKEKVQIMHPSFKIFKIIFAQSYFIRRNGAVASPFCLLKNRLEKKASPA